VSRRTLLVAAGAALVLIGLFLPRGWYDTLPWGPELPPQRIKGVTLLQIAFVLEGALLLWLSFRARIARALAPHELPGLAEPSPDDALDARRAGWLLAAITLLAFVLRLLHVDSDLWLDEITPIIDYGRISTLEVIASYPRSNNHLLYTLLTRAAIALFGEHEWAVRLPAVLFGTATIPALYWVGRMALSRRAALGAALLLAVSYHHIFFSQSARGYSAYLLFAVLSTGLLVMGLRRDRLMDWALYVLCLFLGFAAQLIMTFVAVAHGLVGLAAIAVVRRRGASPLPLLGRLAGVFAAAGLLVFQLYALIVPQALAVANTKYTEPSTGFQPFSLEFLQEMIRGVSAGFGTGLLLGAIPFLVLVGAGFVVILRRHWVLAAALVLPEVVTTLVLFAEGLTFSPRFFLLALPLAELCAVQGLWSLAAAVTRRAADAPRLTARVATALVLAVCTVSALSLRSYYSVPKQDYRGAIHYLESERREGDVVVVHGIAEKGVRYYAARLGVPADAGYTYLRSDAALAAVVASHPGARVFLVSTFSRDFRLNHPELYGQLGSAWLQQRNFPGTVGDGAITIWVRRS
jgi:mannosyltransferase